MKVSEYCPALPATQRVNTHMPKAAPIAWQTAAAPQTPLQRSAFMDACVEWLVTSQPTDDVARLTPRTAAVDTSIPVAHTHAWGDTRSGAHMGVRPCAFCGHSCRASTLGNPFAGAPWVFVCRSCH